MDRASDFGSEGRIAFDALIAQLDRASASGAEDIGSIPIGRFRKT